VNIVERAVFRVTRDADLEVSHDADDLLEAVETQLRRRRFGDVVRVEVSSSASSEMVARLQSGLGADETQIYRVESPLDLSELLELTEIDRPELKPEPWIPAIPSRLASAQTDIPQIFDEIAVATSSCTSPTARSSRASRCSRKPRCEIPTSSR
jgi:polyphosphate kinase